MSLEEKLNSTKRSYLPEGYGDSDKKMQMLGEDIRSQVKDLCNFMISHGGKKIDSVEQLRDCLDTICKDLCFAVEEYNDYAAALGKPRVHVPKYDDITTKAVTYAQKFMDESIRDISKQLGLDLNRGKAEQILS
jgi:hypothetical protein